MTAYPRFVALVCGGRNFGATKAERVLLMRTLDALLVEQPNLDIVHGAARGADELAGRWARHNSVPVREYPADWTRDGRSAGPLRNRRMFRTEAPDLVVAFPGGDGTADMVSVARAAGTEVREVTLG